MDTQSHPLRKWRMAREKPITQAQLGEMIGVGASQVSQIESRIRGVSLSTAKRIAEVTDGAVTPNDLAGYEVTS